MAIIPGDMRIVWISPDVDLTERKSAQINRQSEPYSMSDIVDTVSASIPSGAEWGSITGTLSTQTDLQSALNDKQDTLVSGTNIKTINGESLLGSTDIETALVNPTSTFLPINESDAFTDSPIFAEHSFGSEGFTLLETKVNGLVAFPVGGIEASPSWGLSAEKNLDTNVERVQLGDFDNYTGTGKFEWSTGGNAPPNTSYIKFDTNGLDYFESTYGYFKLDANVGNPSRVDGALWDSNASGLYGFGKGLDAVAVESQEGALWWSLNTGDFIIKDAYGGSCFYSNIGNGETYIQSMNSKLGLAFGAMYISNDLALTASPTTSTKVLLVRDASGNTYHIKLYTPV